MKLATTLLGLALAAACGAADGGPAIRKLTPPKGVTLDAAGQQLFDRANDYLVQAYALLDQGKPGEAADILRKALAIQRRIAVLKPDLVLAGQGDTREEQGTAYDKVESRGGIERLLEIGTGGGQLAADEYDYNGLHLRKVVKESKDVAKEVETKQAAITRSVRDLRNHGGAGGGKRDQQPQQQQPAQDDQAKKGEKPGEQGKPGKTAENPPQPNVAAGGGQQAKAGDKPTGAQPNTAGQPQPAGAGATAQQPNAGQQPTGAQQPGATAQQPNGAQPNAGQQPNGAQQPGATAQQPNAGQQPNGAQPKPGQQPNGAQQPGATAQQPNQGQPNAGAQPNGTQPNVAQPNGAQPNQGQPNAGAQTAAGQANGAQDPAKAQQPGQPAGQPPANGERQPGGPGGAEDLAAQQEAVAQALTAQAEQLRQKTGGGGEAAAAAFDAAARAAGEAAQRLREGDLETAEAASKNAERMIAAAQAGADRAGAQGAQQAVAALGQRLGELQDRQEKALGAARALAGGQAGGDEAAQRDRATQLMLEQGKLKKELDAVAKEMKDLAEGMGDGAGEGRSAERAAHDALDQATKALKDARAGQQAVNAAMALKDGDAGAAAEAMAKVGAALGAARAGVDHADRALAGGGEQQLGRGLAALQQVSTELRRLEKAALAGANGEEQQGAKGEGKDGDGGKGEQAGAGAAGQNRRLSPTLGKALAETSAKLQEQLKQSLELIDAAAPDDAKALLEQLKAPITFDGDVDSSLKKVDRLVVQVEKLEGLINHLVEKEREAQAAHGFLKDPVPAAYQKAVADYLRALAADEPGR